MSQLILSRGTHLKRNFFGRLLNRFELGPYLLMGSLVLFVGLSVVITLMFSAQQVTKGYVLNSLEAQHQELIRESEKKDMDISKVRSLNFIQESSKVKSMVRPAEVAFVSNSGTVVASRY